MNVFILNPSCDHNTINDMTTTKLKAGNIPNSDNLTENAINASAGKQLANAEENRQPSKSNYYRIKRNMLLLLSVLICSTLAYAQSKVLQVTKTDNTVLKLEVSLINKVLFDDSTMIVKMSDGSVNNIPISAIRSFRVYSSTGIKMGKEDLPTIYPNPAKDHIYLANMGSELQTAAVYSTGGRLMLKRMISPVNNSLDIHSLKQGIYFLKLNGRMIKFIKR